MLVLMIFLDNQCKFLEILYIHKSHIIFIEFAVTKIKWVVQWLYDHQ
jgi:hypothetical protein